MKSLMPITLYVAICLLISCGGQQVSIADSCEEYLDVEEVLGTVVEEEVEDSAVYDSMTAACMPLPTKRALVIGLGEQKDPAWGKINGDKDVAYVKEMLSRAGYGDIHTLVNQKATKANIVSAFRNLARACNNGDVVYIHFSGHGQQVTDVSGDEEDGWDESWIPYDAYLKYGVDDRGERHLVDDEVNTLLNAIRSKIGSAGKMLVVVDACHSGTSTRGTEEEETIRGVNDGFVIPDVAHEKREKEQDRWLTFSACKDYQVNQEMENPKVGKLTYALYSVAKEGAVTEGAVRGFVMKNRGRRPQTPVLTGESPECRLLDFFK